MYVSINKDKTIQSLHKSKMKASKEGATGELVRIDDEMPESQLTKVFNFVTGKNISRCRNKAKALSTINSVEVQIVINTCGGYRGRRADQTPAPIKVSQRNKDDAPANENDRSVDLKPTKRVEAVASTASPRKKHNLALTLLELLSKNRKGYTAEQAAYLIGGKEVTMKLAVSHIRTGRANGSKHVVNLNRKTGVYTLCK